jgi:hypothetical protein
VCADLDTLLIALYCAACELPARRKRGRKPQITDAELICLGAAQVLLDKPSDRLFLAWARLRLGHLFPYLPKQPGYNKRMRVLAPEVCQLIWAIAWSCEPTRDVLRLLDTTPLPCAASRETVKRSELAGYAAYGRSPAHSRYFWGFRLVLVCAPNGMPVGFDLVAANVPERQAAREVLERCLQGGEIVLGDKGFAGAEFAEAVAALGAQFVRPARRDEPLGPSFSRIRQWIESTIWSLKGQLSLERHGARTLQGLRIRVAQRLLALAAAISLNLKLGRPPRSLVAYAV